MTHDDSQQTGGVLEYFANRKTRGMHRLETEQPGHRYFAVVGMQCERDELSIKDVGLLRSVADPPGEIELAAALRDKKLLSPVGRYSSAISHELVMKIQADDAHVTTAVAWVVVAALRVRTTSDFLIPAVSNHSWSTIMAVPADSCSISLLEDFPAARRIGEQRAVTQEDCDWVARHLRGITSLHDDARFRLAIDSFATCPHHANLRMSTAALWAGIEALFDVSAEIRFRISTLVATLLEPRGASRVQLYKRMKTLYDFRSKAVHGGDTGSEALAVHVAEARVILARLLIKMIEAGRVPTMDELEGALLGDSLGFAEGA